MRAFFLLSSTLHHLHQHWLSVLTGDIHSHSTIGVATPPRLVCSYGEVESDVQKGVRHREQVVVAGHPVLLGWSTQMHSRHSADRRWYGHEQGQLFQKDWPGCMGLARKAGTKHQRNQGCQLVRHNLCTKMISLIFRLWEQLDTAPGFCTTSQNIILGFQQKGQITLSFIFKLFTLPNH